MESDRISALISLLSVILLVSAGCASSPPLRESPEVSVIGASVKAPGFFWGHDDVAFAYFVRLDEGDAPLRAAPIRSNFRQDEYVFLFNAQPGRYGLVAAGHFNQSSKQGAGVGGGVGGGFSVGASVSASTSRPVIYYLPKALIEKTIVSVGSGDWAFIGDVVLDKNDWEGADEIQRYYFGVLAPGYEDLNWFQKWMMHDGEGHYAVVEESLDQGEESLARFLENSRKLAGEEWVDALLSPVAAGPPQGKGDREVDLAPTMLEASSVAAAAEPEEDSREEATQD
jgi:hypothetical protein